MKTQLLIISLLGLCLSSCIKDKKDSLPQEVFQYQIISVTFFNQTKNDFNSKVIITKIKNAKRIKGPIKALYRKRMKILNLSNKDTIDVIIYGDSNKYFSIKNKFYESSLPIISCDFKKPF